MTRDDGVKRLLDRVFRPTGPGATAGVKGGDAMTREELEQALAHERGLREAAEAERDFNGETIAIMSKDADYTTNIASHAYASRLLAALVAQRQALEAGLEETQAVTNGNPTDWYWMAQRRRQAMLEALATDTAALLAEGEALGVEP